MHVGEIINSLEKATLIPGGSEAIIYTTLSGTVGMLAPFSSREVCNCDHMIISHSFFSLLQDIDFLQHLQMHMRAELPALCGRDHLAYRSYYYPIKVKWRSQIRGRTQPRVLKCANNNILHTIILRVESNR